MKVDADLKPLPGNITTLTAIVCRSADDEVVVECNGGRESLRALGWRTVLLPDERHETWLCPAHVRAVKALLEP